MYLAYSYYILKPFNLCHNRLYKLACIEFGFVENKSILNLFKDWNGLSASDQWKAGTLIVTNTGSDFPFQIYLFSK